MNSLSIMAVRCSTVMNVGMSCNAAQVVALFWNLYSVHVFIRGPAKCAKSAELEVRLLVIGSFVGACFVLFVPQGQGWLRRPYDG